MKEYFGNYRGIVVQNNDPDKAGKIKVFVPHISSTVYNEWITNTDDKSISFIGTNIGEDITDIHDDLKRILPWCECAAPLVGESSSGRFNNFSMDGSVSDSNFLDTTTNTTSANAIGQAPSEVYEETIVLTDAFVNAGDNVNRPNPLAYNYKPNAYSNQAKGSFSIPSVGSHVWVFFTEGNPQFPVYFAASFGQSDWKGIYESTDEPGIDYPGAYENKNAGITEPDHNVAAYRNKYVINQKGGSLEFVNSDLNEKVRMAHYSGSFTEMNNQAIIELAAKNKQQLTLNDSYDTTRGFRNEFTGKNLDEIITRDKYKKVGSLNAEYFDKWKDIVSGIQEYKQLFEIKRTGDNSVKNDAGITMLKRNSLLQERSGSFSSFPVTDGTTQYDTLANTNARPTYVPVSSVATGDGPQIWVEPPKAGPSGSSPSASDWMGDWGPGGVGKSPSTEGGNWDIDEQKDQLQELIEANQAELTEIENELGIGGSEISQITKHKVETIGMMMNDFGSIRLDDIGKLVNNEVLVGESSVYMSADSSPLVEYVHVQDLPGGNYSLNVCNRFNVVVGAGGLNLKSYGATNITGTVTNVTGEQVNVASENEVNLDAGTINISANILRLRNKRQRQILIENSLGVNRNVIIGGGLHVEGETYVQHVTAPVEYQKTLPTTAFGALVSGVSYTATFAGTINGNAGVWDGTVTIQSSQPDIVAGFPHSHVFPNLPLTLLPSNTDVRTAASELNSGETRSEADPQHNAGKNLAPA